MKPLKIDHEELEKEIHCGNPYIQVGKKRYLLMEENEVYDVNSYEVTDLEEGAMLIKALEEDNPVLSDKEIKKMLGN